MFEMSLKCFNGLDSFIGIFSLTGSVWFGYIVRMRSSLYVLDALHGAKQYFTIEWFQQF
jgi:hypothetical protein